MDATSDGKAYWRRLEYTSSNGDIVEVTVKATRYNQKVEWPIVYWEARRILPHLGIDSKQGVYKIINNNMSKWRAILAEHGIDSDKHYKPSFKKGTVSRLEAEGCAPEHEFSTEMTILIMMHYSTHQYKK